MVDSIRGCVVTEETPPLGSVLHTAGLSIPALAWMPAAAPWSTCRGASVDLQGCTEVCVDPHAGRLNPPA